jgi:hypothetical protein
MWRMFSLDQAGTTSSQVSQQTSSPSIITAWTTTHATYPSVPFSEIEAHATSDAYPAETEYRLLCNRRCHL